MLGELFITLSSIFLVCKHETRRPCWLTKPYIFSQNLKVKKSLFPESLRAQQRENSFVLVNQHSPMTAAT